MTTKTKEHEPLFFVYPDGYDSDEKEAVYSEESLDSMDLPSSACISSTSYYEKKLNDKFESINKRWNIKKMTW